MVTRPFPEYTRYEANAFASSRPAELVPEARSTNRSRVVVTGVNVTVFNIAGMTRDPRPTLETLPNLLNTLFEQP
jgi:hypothetical protein